MCQSNNSALMWRFAMGDIVNLRSNPIDLNSDTGHQFVTDCTRAAEGLITDKELAEKYELSPADWQSITKDMASGVQFGPNGSAACITAPPHEKRRPSTLSKPLGFSIK
jgi:hypothetical protein